MLIFTEKAQTCGKHRHL